ncbi:MAG: response regulator [Pseudomonadota bacterium]
MDSAIKTKAGGSFPREATYRIQCAKNLLETMLDSMPNGVAIIDGARTIRYINPSALDLMEYESREQVVGNNCHGLLCACVEPSCPNLNLGEHVDNLEQTIITQTGEKKTVLKNLKSIMVDDEQMLLETFIDITDRKKAEENHSDSTWKFKLLVKNLPNVVFKGYKDWSVDLFDNKIEAITGYSGDDFNSRRLLWKDVILEDDLPGAGEEFIKALKTDRTYIREYRIRTRDGSLKWTQERGYIVLNSRGDINHIDGVFFEITARKKAEEDLRQSKMAAEAASVAKSQFLANLSHEIRTPLNGIIGMTEVAMERITVPEHRAILETIEKESNTLLDIVNKALDFSKIEAGKLELASLPFDLRTLMENLASSMALRAMKKGLNYASFMSPRVPSRLVGDSVRLRQILNNLTGNALKFTNAGSITVKVSLETSDEETDTLRFDIIDTGIGIPRNRLNSIFDSFTQADGSTTRNYGGTGLGTTISKHLTELMGGTIGVTSRVGEGSHFWFTARFTKFRQTEEPSGSQPRSTTGLKVVIVDDDEAVLDILEAYLDTMGCISSKASSGLEALEIIGEAARENVPIDMVLTDITMPAMNGFELVARMKADIRFREIPVILLSGYSLKDEQVRIMESGVDGFMQKPILLEPLKAVIQSVLMKTPGAGYDTLITPQILDSEPRKDLRILLVEDYQTNQEVALFQLGSSGFTVDLAENGQQALDALKINPYDIVLMDMQMPVMDGYEAIRIIREKEAGGRLQVPESDPPVIIAMTAHAMNGDREKCIRAGADDYLAKPIKKKELLSMVRRWSNVLDQSRNKAAQNVQPSLPFNHDLPLDLECAVMEFDNDRPFFMQILNGFLDRVPIQIQMMHRAFQAGDFLKIAREAHAIKGGSANLTATALARTSSELEISIKKGDTTAAADLINTLEYEYNRLKAYCSTLG